MRDHRNLEIFNKADQLVLEIYKQTASFPRYEVYGIISQMRRSAMSIASNIVEGCARETPADYLHFLSIAYGSAKELEYQVSVAARLGYLPNDAVIVASSQTMCRSLNAFITGLKSKIAEARKRKDDDSGLKPKA